MKHKIDLNTPFKDLDGTEGEKLGKILAQHIAISKGGDAVKLYGWSVELSKGNEMELDNSDYDNLKNFVKNCDTLPVIWRGQILQILNNAKSE